jgi:hypothetical protein
MRPERYRRLLAQAVLARYEAETLADVPPAHFTYKRTADAECAAFELARRERARARVRAKRICRGALR